MNSIPFAMTWELLRRGRWNLLAGTLVATLVTAVMVGTLRNQGAWIPNDAHMILLHFVFMQLTMFIIGAVALLSAGNPLRLFALPVRTSTIVTWQLLPTMAAVALAMAASTAAINAYFRLNWPLWGPALFMATTIAAIQAALWLTDKSAWLAAAMAVVGGPLGIWFKSRYGRPFDKPDHYWITLASEEIGFLLAVAAASFVVANVAVARNRRGDPALSLGVLAWFDRTLTRTSVSKPTFRSAGHAQSWYEWRQKGYIMPAIASVCLSAIFATWSIFSRNPQSLFAGFAICGFSLPLFALVGALVVGNTGPRDGQYDMGPFLATRPITTAAMSKAVLRTAAQTVFVAWVIWAVAISLLVMILATHDQRVAGELFTWQSGVGFFGLGTAILLSTWLVVANGASIGLTGRQGLFVKVLIAVLGIFFGSLLGAKYVLTQEGITLFGNLLTILTGTAFVAGTIWAFAAARSKGLVDKTWMYASVAAFTALGAVVSTAFWTQYRPEESTWPPFIFVIGLAALVVAPLATAPLALAWNRTR